MELPPRARRIRLPTMQCGEKVGTTSACAENTAFLGVGWWVGGNYLRVRGEYSSPAQPTYTTWELPPRARRILALNINESNKIGTTSACAENTGLTLTRFSPLRNYLRVRGEYIRCPLYTCPTLELPPRARRIPFDNLRGKMDAGTTSACAENTCPGLSPSPSARNYLRVRGEYLPCFRRYDQSRELPPRARRIRRGPGGTGNKGGTTSACAENTRRC